MEDRTADEVAAVFSAAGSSVTLINADANYAAYITRTGYVNETEADWKDMIKRNVRHLELIKEYKKIDETTSIWTTEDFTEINAAITKGKTLY